MASTYNVDISDAELLLSITPMIGSKGEVNFHALPNIPINAEHRSFLDQLADIASSKSPLKRIKKVSIHEEKNIQFSESFTDNTNSNISTLSLTLPQKSIITHPSSIISRPSSNFKNFAGKSMDDLMTPADLSSTSSSFSAVTRRPRAMSEPSVIDESWVTTLQLASKAITSPRTMTLLSNDSSTTISKSNSTSSFSPKATSLSLSSFFSLAPLLQSAELGETSAEHALDEFSAAANKSGRIGIYSREERALLLQRFRAKRLRRVWKKKIRYSCRKELADSRVRVKGRFIKAADPDSSLTSAVGESGDSSCSGSRATDIVTEEEKEKGSHKRAAVSSKPWRQGTYEGREDNNDDDDEDDDDQLLPPPGKRMRRHSIAF